MCFLFLVANNTILIKTRAQIENTVLDGFERMTKFELTSYEQIFPTHMCMHKFEFNLTTNIEIKIVIEFSYNVYKGRQMIIQWTTNTEREGRFVSFVERASADIVLDCLNDEDIFKWIEGDDKLRSNRTFGVWLCCIVNKLKLLNCDLCAANSRSSDYFV